MDYRQVFIVVFSFAITFQVGAAQRRAEESVCCEPKWNRTDLRGGCCGHGWGSHCCYTSVIPQTHQNKTIYIRTETCCYGEERIPVPSDKVHNQLYKSIVWLNAIVFVTAAVLTALILFGCCRSFWSTLSVYPNKRIISTKNNRYGAMLETWPNGRLFPTTDAFGFTSSYPGTAQPTKQTMYARLEYQRPPTSYYQPQTQKAPSYIRSV